MGEKKSVQYDYPIENQRNIKEHAKALGSAVFQAKTMIERGEADVAKVSFETENGSIPVMEFHNGAVHQHDGPTHYGRPSHRYKMVDGVAWCTMHKGNCQTEYEKSH